MLSSLPSPNPALIMWAGILLFALTVVQMLIGYRKIHFKGRKHLKVHKILAWVIVGGALLHGFLGMLYLGVFG